MTHWLSKVATREALRNIPQIAIGFASPRVVEPGETFMIGVQVQCSVVLASLMFPSTLRPIDSFSLTLERAGEPPRVLASGGVTSIEGEVQAVDLSDLGVEVRAERPACKRLRRGARDGDVLVFAWENTSGKARTLHAVCYGVLSEPLKRRRKAASKKLADRRAAS